MKVSELDFKEAIISGIVSYHDDIGFKSEMSREDIKSMASYLRGYLEGYMELDKYTIK